MGGARSRTLLAVLVFGYAFLYLPIFSVMIYSFNESRLVTVWAGFSLKWWRAALANEALLSAAVLSLQLAFVTACVATILGTAAGFALSRRPASTARTWLGAIVAAPMALPEIVLGIASLLLFVALEAALGWPQRGFVTLAIAHITFSIAYVAIVVRARLQSFDRSLEEAALDLGARPVTVLWRITLPVIRPALIAGWLLAFTLSLDDLILSQFVAGPASQTLPMQIYSGIRLGVSPQINVIATVLIGMVLVVVGGFALMVLRTGHRQGH